MLTVAQVRTLLPRNAYTISIDLTDAYWHVPIARQFTPYLGFRLGNKKYAFQLMPFGLNIAPKVFTKLAATVVKELRNRGIQVAAYLDDWIVWASSPEECSRMASETIRFLQSLGFRINEKKSRLQPAQAFTWLGLDWDLTSHCLSIPPKKRKEITKLIRSFLRRMRATRRVQERVLGSLLFASITDPFLKVRLKSFNGVWRHRALPTLRDKVSRIPRRLKNMLRHYTRAASLSKSVALCPPEVSMVMHTNASLTGWGVHTQGL